MIQVARFHDGGFVIHKACVGGVRYSAWFSNRGDLLSAERSGSDGRSRSVPDREWRTLKELARIGQRYVVTPGSVG